MIPQRHFAAEQNLQRLQRSADLNPPPDARYTDRKKDFPRFTATILEEHTNEVWNLEWSHDGNYLASAGRDKSAIIWSRGTTGWTAKYILRNHEYAVGCLAWSPDDSILLTSTEYIIMIWNTSTGSHIRSLSDHTETITNLEWLSDGLGFVSGGLDRKIIIWNSDGTVRDAWDPIALHLTGVTISPDQEWLVGVGVEQALDSQTEDSSIPRPHRMTVYNMATKQPVSSVQFDSGSMSTSMTKSADFQHLLISFSPNETQLWDVQTLRIIRRYKDLKQSRHVIRSCFGGIDGNFVLSGSEDGIVYVWHRDTGILLEALTGHGEGSVNSVAWNPTNEGMFASCSDDRTIRIWEAPPHGVEPTLEIPHVPAPSTSSETKYLED